MTPHGLENPNSKSPQTPESAEFCGLEHAQDAMFAPCSASHTSTVVGTTNQTDGGKLLGANLMSEEIVEVKPCPFCGHKPWKHTQNGLHQLPSGEWRQHVWCFTEGCGLIGPERDTATEAIAAWNTRLAQPAPDKLKAERDALESERDELFDALGNVLFVLVL